LTKIPEETSWKKSKIFMFEKYTVTFCRMSRIPRCLKAEEKQVEVGKVENIH
jgi:hypothetical protein